MGFPGSRASWWRDHSYAYCISHRLLRGEGKGERGVYVILGLSAGPFSCGAVSVMRRRAYFSLRLLPLTTLLGLERLTPADGFQVVSPMLGRLRGCEALETQMGHR